MKTKLTEKEAQQIKAIVDHDEYGEKGCLDNHPWSFAVCGTKAQGAVLGSLVKKGLVGQDGTGKDASCWLTEAGIKAYIEVFGKEGVWRSGSLNKEKQNLERLAL